MVFFFVYEAANVCSVSLLQLYSIIFVIPFKVYVTFRKFFFLKMSSVEKKSCLVSINPFLIDNKLMKHFREAYTNRLSIDEKRLYKSQLK